MDPRLRSYIIQSRFYGVYHIGHITLDWGLITSLVEKWHPKTHTFHLPVGKMTITLQDVAVILELCIHGLPIIGTCDIDWSLLCYELLSVTSPTSENKGLAILTWWLCHQFSHPPIDSDDVTLERYGQAFILTLIGSTHLQTRRVPTSICVISHCIETWLIHLCIVGVV